MSEATRLDRRGFLVGAAATAGVVVAGARCEGDGLPPIDADTAEMDRMAQESGFDEAARASCPDIGQDAPDLSPVDENTEIVLGLLWALYGKKAMPKANDIDFGALELGRKLERGHIRADLTGVSLARFMAMRFGDYRTRWERMAPVAAGQATHRTISETAFQAGWDDSDGAGKEARLCGELDEATETIGNHLWFRFGAGVARKDPKKSFSRAIIESGRFHSRSYIRKNTKGWGVVTIDSPDCKVGGPPVYGAWHKPDVGRCAWRAGRAAAKRAGLGTTIDESHFHNAWCEGHEAIKRLARTGGWDYRIRSGACA